MHSVEREHSICCGHRVVRQGGKCENLHGHNYRFHFNCSSETLDKKGMVIDFGVIKALLCNWLEDHWDHRFLVWKEDPLGPGLAELDQTVVFVPFNPTAENIAEYIVTEVAPMLLKHTGVRLISCTVDETDKCSATYESEDLKGVLDALDELKTWISKKLGLISAS